MPIIPTCLPIRISPIHPRVIILLRTPCKVRETKRSHLPNSSGPSAAQCRFRQSFKQERPTEPINPQSFPISAFVQPANENWFVPRPLPPWAAQNLLAPPAPPLAPPLQVAHPSAPEPTNHCCGIPSLYSTPASQSFHSCQLYLLGLCLGIRIIRSTVTATHRRHPSLHRRC